MNFSDLVQSKNSLLVELRCNNTFNEQIFTDIKNYLNEYLPGWKAGSLMPVADATAIFSLIDELSGGRQILGRRT